jgi:hypothetical protein
VSKTEYHRASVASSTGKRIIQAILLAMLLTVDYPADPAKTFTWSMALSLIEKMRGIALA